MSDEFFDPELARTYCGEIIEQVAQLQEQVLALESGGDTAAAVAAAFRLAHNLKGSGASYGVRIVTDICQPLEDLLDALRAGRTAATHDMVECLLQHVDLLADVAKTGAVGQDLAPFAARLRALCPAAATPAADRGGLRVLVAENSATTRRIIADILRRAGCRVQETDDGIAALRLLEEQRCDLLVTGLDLKSLSGHALTAAVKADTVLRRVRVVYVTSIATAGRDAPLKPDLIVAKDAHLAQTLPAALARLHDARA